MSSRRPEIERSLALHRAVVQRLQREPALLSRARERIDAWRRDGRVAASYIDGWAEILALPPGERDARILQDDARSHDLRQVSPFAGALPPRERWRLLRELSKARHEAR